MLDGAARLKDMFAECERAGMPAVAMTDHGNVYGAYDFWAKAAPRPASSRSSASRPTWRPSTAAHRQPVRWGTPAQKDDDVSGAGAYTHMTLLAETTEGMHNLFRLSSLASLEGYFRKPRMDRELLAAARQGDHRHHRLPERRGADQAAARPVPAGPRGGRRVPRHLRRRGTSSSRSWTTAWTSSSGSGTGCAASPGSWTCRSWSPTTRTTRVEADAKAHEVLLCVQTGTNMADPGRFKFEGTGYYLKSPQEMRALFTRRGLAGGLRLHAAHRRAGGRRVPAERT